MDRVAQLDRGAHRAERVVLGGDRDAEHGHHRVAHELLDRAAVALEDHARGLVVAPHEGAQRLRIGAVADRGRAGQVAEQDGDDLPHLARRRRRGERCAARRAEAEVGGALAPALSTDRHVRESIRAVRARLDRLEAGGEVAERGGLLDDPHAAQLAARFGDSADHLDHVVDVALRVDAARDGEAHQLHRRRLLASRRACWPNITVPISQPRMPPSR